MEIENVLSNKSYNNEEYKTLDYSRLVSLLIPAVNALSAKVGQELDDKRKDIASTIMAKEPEKTNDNNAEQSTEIDD